MTPPPPARGRRTAADLEALLAELGERRARTLGRLISAIEDDPQHQRQIVARAFPRTGRARVVGITGPPGAGKSTLVDRLARLCRERGETVAILAVDPTSPFSGGAILGDRIRMQALHTDPGVFIRSMATRGAMGGLARATRDAVDLLDAAGFDWVLVETVGVGQDEIDVVRSVDTVVVVTVPGLGDEIQAIKAGILEIADVFVVNKADREGAKRAVRDLEMLLGMADHPAWLPPILETVASTGEGVAELLAAVERHRGHLTASGELARRRLAQLRLRVETRLEERILLAADRVVGVERAVEEGFARGEDPDRIADRLFEGVVAASATAGAAAGAAAGASAPGAAAAGGGRRQGSER
jgi:LAO/AO transport system kinase